MDSADIGRGNTPLHPFYQGSIEQEKKELCSSV